MPGFGLLLCASSLMACRVENPAFGIDDETAPLRDDTSIESEESSTKESSDSDEGTQSTTEPLKPSSGGSPSTQGPAETSPSNDASLTDSQNTTSAPEPADVKDVCNKGAAYCYDMKVIQDDYLDNKAPVNRSTALQISSIDSSATEPSPAFGNRLRLGMSSFAKTSTDIVIPAKSDFGIDIWFTADFSKSDSMVLVRVGELMSIQISKDKKAICKLVAADTTIGETNVRTVQGTYTGRLPWHMVSCRLKRGQLQVWHTDAPLASGSVDLVLSSQQSARVMIGDLATKNLDALELGGFVGDLHLMRIWTDLSNYDQVLRTELRSLGLDPVN